jgi:hypothetical protein
MKRVLALVIVLLFVPLTASAQDFCEGNFDYDDDVDGTDAFTFKEDFGRSLLKNPCPPDGPAPVPMTWQLNSYHPGDDGDLTRGISVRGTRFVDNEDGTVTDRLTGLMWTQNADLCGDGSGADWETSFQCIALMNALSLYDYNDWRFPNVREMLSLVDFGNPFTLDFAPFVNIDYNLYWTSTSFFWNQEDEAFAVLLGDPSLRPREKINSSHLWPVRGGH